MNNIYQNNQNNRNSTAYVFTYALIWFVTTIYATDFILAVYNYTLEPVNTHVMLEYVILRIIISAICRYRNDPPVNFDNAFLYLLAKCDENRPEHNKQNDLTSRLMKMVEVFYQIVFTVTIVAFLFGYNFHFFDFWPRILMYMNGFIFSSVVTLLYTFYGML
jgi:hypothetical protein